MEKKIKKSNDKTFKSGEVATILEGIKDDFRAFGDGQKLLTDKVNKMDVRLSSVEDKLGSVKGRANLSGVKLAEIGGELKELKRDNKNSYKNIIEYLSRIEDEISDIKSEIKELKLNLSKKADVYKLAELEKRIIKVEKLVFSKLA